MREAVFRNARVAVGPITLDVEPGERSALCLATASQASVAALLAAGIAKATSGSVLIGDFDPRVQSVHCKRIAGFVPHEPLAISEAEFMPYIAYRAALWQVPPQVAAERATGLLSKLDGMHEAFQYSLIGALIAAPKLLVMDRPPAVYSDQLAAVTPGVAVLITSVKHGIGQP